MLPTVITIDLLRFRSIMTTILLASIALNAIVMPLSITPDYKEADEASAAAEAAAAAAEADGDASSQAAFDYGDYKYVYINYISWIVILLLVYGLAALTYTAMSDAVPDILTALCNFNDFIVGPGNPRPPARPLAQLAVCFVLVSLASSMFMVESKRVGGGERGEAFLDGATRPGAYNEDAAEQDEFMKREDEAVRRAAYRKDLVVAVNWIHAVCMVCFAVTFIRVAQA